MFYPSDDDVQLAPTPPTVRSNPLQVFGRGRAFGQRFGGDFSTRMMGRGVIPCEVGGLGVCSASGSEGHLL